MNTNQYRSYLRNKDRRLDQALAEIMAGPRSGIQPRIPGGALDRFINIGVGRYGSAFEGFAYGIAEGKIGSGGIEDAGRLYRHCYVGTFGDDFQTVDYLLTELGIVDQFGIVKAALDWPLRELLVIEEESAWRALVQHYYVTDDDNGTYAYRRRPQQPANK